MNPTRMAGEHCQREQAQQGDGDEDLDEVVPDSRLIWAPRSHVFDPQDARAKRIQRIKGAMFIAVSPQIASLDAVQGKLPGAGGRHLEVFQTRPPAAQCRRSGRVEGTATGQFARHPVIHRRSFMRSRASCTARSYFAEPAALTRGARMPESSRLTAIAIIQRATTEVSSKSVNPRLAPSYSWIAFHARKAVMGQAVTIRRVTAARWRS